MHKDFQTMKDEALRIAEVTHYNGSKLLDGGTTGAGAKFQFQVGHQEPADHVQKVIIARQVHVKVQGSDLKFANTSRQALTRLDIALNGNASLHESRAELGSSMASMSLRIDFLADQQTRLTMSLGERRDADLAAESAEFTRTQVLQNAGIAVLSQANASAGMALRLLG